MQRFTWNEIGMMIIAPLQWLLFVHAVISGGPSTLAVLLTVLTTICLVWVMRLRKKRLMAEFVALRVTPLNMPYSELIGICQTAINRLRTGTSFCICWAVTDQVAPLQHKNAITNAVMWEIGSYGFLTSYVGNEWNINLDDYTALQLRIAWLEACIQHKGVVNVNYVIKNLYPNHTPAYKSIVKRINR